MNTQAPDTANSTKHKVESPGLILLMLPALTFIILFFFIPIGLVFFRAFFDAAGNITLNPLFDLIRSPYYRRIIGFTLYQAFLSTIFSLLLGFPGAYFLARYNFPGKKIIKAASALPFVLPSILVVLGFVLFFGNQGVVNRFVMNILSLEQPPFKILYSITAIILAHGFFNFPICLRIVHSAWERISPNQEYAAYSLKAKPWRVFYTVILPRLLPALVTAASLIFMFCFTSFAIILVLGGGPRYSTMEVEIYRLTRISLNLEAAGALAFLGIIISLLLFICYITTQKRFSHIQEPGWVRISRKPSITVYISAVIYCAIILFIVAGPLLSVIIRSFQGPVTWGGAPVYTLKWYTELFTGGIISYAIINSFNIAVAAVLITIPVSTILAYVSSRQIAYYRYGTLLESFLMLPMAVSSIVLGLGYVIMGILIQNKGYLFIVLAHTIITYPFVMRAISPAIKSIPRSMRFAALSLGAHPWKVFFTIELPLIKSALFSGAAFAFAISMGEINATLILADRQMTTIPIAMYRLIGAYNFYGACALGTILILICLAVFFYIEQIEGVELT